MTDTITYDEAWADELILNAERAYEATFAVVMKNMRHSIQSWSQERLLEAAGGCGEEIGDGHCWRCAAWALWVDRNEEENRTNCKHPHDQRYVTVDDTVMCRRCAKSVGRVV